MIVSQDLKPRQRIIHEALASDLNISRTPVKKALTRLEEMGLVTVDNGQTYVAQYPQTKLLCIYEIREVLEGLAARLAARWATAADIERMRAFFKPFSKPIAKSMWKKYGEADLAFHEFLAVHGSNEMLARVFTRVPLHLPTIRSMRVRPPDVSMTEHFDIIAAIAEKNGDRAEQLMRSHVRLTAVAVQNEIELRGEQI
jgi:DNA-binding GntR family transcriptional regulator